MMLIEIIGIGEPDGWHLVNNGLPPLTADAEWSTYDHWNYLTVRKMQFLFNEDVNSLDCKLHRFVSHYQIACFAAYSEVVVRYKRKKNA